MGDGQHGKQRKRVEMSRQDLHLNNRQPSSNVRRIFRAKCDIPQHPGGGPCSASITYDRLGI